MGFSEVFILNSNASFAVESLSSRAVEGDKLTTIGRNDRSTRRDHAKRERQ